MPPSLADTIRLLGNVLKTFILLFLDIINPSIKHNFELNHLDNPDVLSKYINRDVKIVEVIEENDGNEEAEKNINSDDGPTAGNFGSTSSRRSFIAHLANGEKLHLVAKTISKSLPEKICLLMDGIYENELIFYEKICPLFVDHFRLPDESGELCEEWIPCPRCYCVKRIGFTNFVIILEDTRVRKQGSIFHPTGCRFQDIEKLKAVVKMYAYLHAFFWNDSQGLDVRRWLWNYSPTNGKPIGNTPAFNGFFPAIARDIVLDKRVKTNQVKMFDDCLEAADLFSANFHKVRAFWSSSGTMTLAHGDSHLGNIFVSRECNKSNVPNLCGIIDFQFIVLDQGMRDITYLLLISCSSEWLPKVEEEVIHYYLAQLERALQKRFPSSSSYKVPSYEETYFLYRSYSLWVLHCWFLCCGLVTGFSDEFLIKGMQNILNSCHRLDSLGAIKQILNNEHLKKNL